MHQMHQKLAMRTSTVFGWDMVGRAVHRIGLLAHAQVQACVIHGQRRSGSSIGMTTALHCCARGELRNSKTKADEAWAWTVARADESSAENGVAGVECWLKATGPRRSRFVWPC